MKVSIIAAITLDGFIGRTPNHHADWTPVEDKKHYIRFTKESGVMVMGSTTFDTMGKPLPGRKTVVYTSNPEKYANVDVQTTQSTPQELIEELRRQGYNHIAICGGSHIYSMFLESGVVTDLYITIVPLLFGQGVSLLSDSSQAKLKLVEHSMLNDNTALHHYEVM